MRQDYLKTSNLDLGEFFDENNALSQNEQKQWKKILDSICTDDLHQSNVSSILEHVEISAIGTSIGNVPDYF